jgi:hypothetical protein
MGEQIWLHFWTWAIATLIKVDKFKQSMDRVKYIAIEF